MQNKKTIFTLIVFISILALAASTVGIFSNQGSGSYEFLSIRNQTIPIYGIGLYKDMSSDVAVQGIAQDYVTLFLAIPLLLIAYASARKNSTKGTLFLGGILLYFFLTYMFYMNMAMFNAFFLVYVALAGLSFFAFALTLLSINTKQLNNMLNENTPVKFIGGFLIFNASCIALLWLSIIIPPLLDGSIVPLSVQHYTSLTVQAFDLSIFLPLSFLSGLLLIRKNTFGFLFAPVYLVFLSMLMIALIAKIIAMARIGVDVVPAIIVIPAIAGVSIICGFSLFRNINQNKAS